MSSDTQSDAEQATFAMACPHCKKTTQCRELKGGQEVKPGEVPKAHRYHCTECGMGWGIQTGGAFDLNTFR